MFCQLKDEIRAYLYQTDYYIEFENASLMSLNQKKNYIVLSSKQELFIIKKIQTTPIKIFCDNSDKIVLMAVIHDNKIAAICKDVCDEV